MAELRTPLHFDRVAPGGVTLPFLLAAPFFGALAAGLLLLGGEDVLFSRWHPALIGALHVYTIGFLLFAIAGALLQIGPVIAARAALQSERFARALRFMLGAGGLLFGCGMLHQWRALLLPALLLLGIALPLWFSIALRGTGWRRPGRDLLFAFGGLGVGMLLGLRLLAGHAVPALGLPRELTDLHAGWMLLGGVAPLVMAIGIIVIPMFQHTAALPRVTRWLPAMSVTGMLLASLPATRAAGALVAAAALCIFAVVVLHAQARRRSSVSDPTVQLFALAMLSALAGIGAWLAATLVPAHQGTLHWLGGVLLIAGFAGSAVHGMALKIVPFLVRMRLQRAQWEQALPARGLPGFRDLLPRHRARWLPAVQAGAIALLAAAVLVPGSGMLLVAALLLAAAQTLLGFLLLRAVINGVRALADMQPRAARPHSPTETAHEA